MRKFSDVVRESADIVRIISEYVALKGSGSALKALCPFHSEKTPSFTVHRDQQFFHCFGCGAGGSVFDFVMRTERVTFPESVHIVAEKCGIPIPTESAVADRQADQRRELLDLHERAAGYFRKMLSSEDAGPARQVLEKRRIQQNSIERCGLGFAPKTGLLTYLHPKAPAATGLFSKNDRGEAYHRIRRRLTSPIWNARGT